MNARLSAAARATVSALLLSLAVLLAACDLFGEDDPGEKPLDTSVLRPLAEGNYWQRVQHVYTDGEIDETFTDTGRIVVEAVRPVQVAGTSYTAAVVRVILPGEIPERVAVPEWNGPEGLYKLGLYAPDDTVLTAPQLLYKYPVEVGERWAVPRLVYDPYAGEITVRDTLLYTCVATDEPFETPLGTFEAVATTTTTAKQRMCSPIGTRFSTWRRG
jgi:hypothetical protein